MTTPWTSAEIEAAVEANEKDGMKRGYPTELHDELAWGDFRDHEKREMSFVAGALWALSFFDAAKRQAPANSPAPHQDGNGANAP